MNNDIDIEKVKVLIISQPHISSEETVIDVGGYPENPAVPKRLIRKHIERAIREGRTIEKISEEKYRIEE